MSIVCYTHTIFWHALQVWNAVWISCFSSALRLSRFSVLSFSVCFSGFYSALHLSRFSAVSFSIDFLYLFALSPFISFLEPYSISPLLCLSLLFLLAIASPITYLRVSSPCLTFSWALHGVRGCHRTSLIQVSCLAHIFPLQQATCQATARFNLPAAITYK